MTGVGIEEPRKKRVVDHSTRDARLAVRDVIAKLAPLRSRVALLRARTERQPVASERRAILNECEVVATACGQARIEIAERLAGAPSRVSRHSRVTDVEKAIDNLDVAAREVQGRLQ